MRQILTPHSEAHQHKTSFCCSAVLGAHPHCFMSIEKHKRHMHVLAGKLAYKENFVFFKENEVLKLRLAFVNRIDFSGLSTS